MANDETLTPDQRIARELARVRKGGAEKYHRKNAEQRKLFVRERLRLLLDEGSFVEDGALANGLDPELPADGVVTGLGTIDGRAVAVMANDSTVKAGSWGKRTVEKILRIQEVAAAQRLPLFYLVDSAGARITDQIEMFPGRRRAWPRWSSARRSRSRRWAARACTAPSPGAATSCARARRRRCARRAATSGTCRGATASCRPPRRPARPCPGRRSTRSSRSTRTGPSTSSRSSPPSWTRGRSWR